MRTQLERAEQNVEQHSAALKKPLGLFDLVVTQILFVVGSSWVGTAAKLGPSHLFFWSLAILLFYIPQAAVVIYLNRLMPFEGGLYQWAKLGFNEFAGFLVGWNSSWSFFPMSESRPPPCSRNPARNFASARPVLRSHRWR